MPRFGYNDMKEKYEKLFDYYKDASSELVKPFLFEQMKKELPDENDEVDVYLLCQLLEFFSKAVRLVSEDEYLESADYLYERVVHEAFDTTCGGYYERLKSEGSVLSDKKLLKTQYMAMVALGEYACAKKISKDEEYHYTAVLNRALAQYTMITHYAIIKGTENLYPVMNKDWSASEADGISSGLNPDDKECVAKAFRHLYADLAFIDPKATATLNLISETASKFE